MFTGSRRLVVDGMTCVKISVIVPFFNAAATLKDCLEAFVPVDFPGFQVVMVDNNASDGSTQIAREMATIHPDRFIYLFEPRQGPSYARNTGAKHAGGKLLAFLDADCVAASDWLIRLEAAFTGPEIGAVAGRVIGHGCESALDKFHYLFTLKGPDESRTLKEFTLVEGGFPTANLAVRKEIFDRIGGFDESMKIYSEDYDLCARIYQAGFTIRYTTEALVYHRHRNSLKGTWRQGFGFGTGHAVLLKKHFRHLMILDLPRMRIVSARVPLRAWLNLTGADKKLLAVGVLSVFWPLFSLAVPIYLLFLYRDIGRRLNSGGLDADAAQRWQMVFLLLFKSAAMTAGRVAGSIRRRVLCL